MKILLVICFAVFPLLSYAQNGEELLTGWKKPFKQNYVMKTADLEIEGSFPVNTAHPFEIKGFDRRGMAYSVLFETSEITAGVFKTTYVFKHNGAARSGSVITKIGQSGTLMTKADKGLENTLSFETTIRE